MANDERPTYVDISRDDRAWEDVCPDQWFAPDHVLGKELQLQIAAVEMEQYPDSPPKPFLKFLNDPKWLRVSRDSRTVLKELFGPAPSNCVGKWITITAGPNQMKTIVIKILPRITQPPVQSPATVQTPALPQMSAEDFARFQAFMAQQQQKG